MIISELDDGGGCELLNVSMQDARKLAQALLEAADEIDRWRRPEEPASPNGWPVTPVVADRPLSPGRSESGCVQIEASPNRRRLRVTALYAKSIPPAGKS